MRNQTGTVKLTVIKVHHKSPRNTISLQKYTIPLKKKKKKGKKYWGDREIEIGERKIKNVHSDKKKKKKILL